MASKGWLCGARRRRDQAATGAYACHPLHVKNASEACCPASMSWVRSPGKSTSRREQGRGGAGKSSALSLQAGVLNLTRRQLLYLPSLPILCQQLATGCQQHQLPWVPRQTKALVWPEVQGLFQGDQCNQLPPQNQDGETVPAYTAQALEGGRKKLCRVASIVLSRLGACRICG